MSTKIKEIIYYYNYKNKRIKQIFKDYQKDLINQTNLIKQIKRIKSKLVGLEDKQHKYQKLIDSDIVVFQNQTS